MDLGIKTISNGMPQLSINVKSIYEAIPKILVFLPKILIYRKMRALSNAISE